MNPKCCGLDAVWTVQSPTLQYWFCKECKKEVSANAGNSSALTNPDAAFEDLAKEFERIMQTKDSTEDAVVPYTSFKSFSVPAEWLGYPLKEVKNASPFRIARTIQDYEEATEPCWRSGCTCHERAPDDCF